MGRWLSVLLLLPVLTVLKAETPETEGGEAQGGETVKMAPAVDSGGEFELTTDWKLSRRPWAIFVGADWPEVLAPGSPCRTALEKSHFKLIRVESPKELPRGLRHAAPQDNRLHLCWYDGSRRERLSPEELAAQEATFPDKVKELSRRSFKDRFERLSRRFSHCLQVVNHPRTGEKARQLRLEELREMAVAEAIEGLPEIVDKLEVEIVSKRTTMELRVTVAELSNIRIVPVTAGGIGGVESIELPQMSLRAVRTTVSAP